MRPIINDLTKNLINPLILSESVAPESCELCLWLDSSDAATITESSGVVSQINDKSGEGNNFTAIGSPVTNASITNSLNVIDFNGSSGLTSAANFKFTWKNATINPIVNAQANYTKPTDMRKMLWAKVVDTTITDTGADEGKMTIITDTLSDFQQSHDMDDDGDKPQYIYEEGGEIWLYPVPNSTTASTYTIKYKYSEYPDTLAATDTPAFDSRWHYILYNARQS